MVNLHYDGTWKGLLTLVFEVYELKYTILHICREENTGQEDLFTKSITVSTDESKAQRVLQGIVAKVGRANFIDLYHAFLSETTAVESLIVRVIQYYLKQGKNAVQNYGHDDVLALKKIVKAVSRERHRMKAFVRFQQMQDGLYAAVIEPDFNVLPLIGKHFKDRYADQSWLIYDVKRKYGLYYDQSTWSEVTIDIDLQDMKEVKSKDEDQYAHLWQRYFKATNITERKNTKLHLQHVPKRYWKYLNEKNE